MDAHVNQLRHINMEEAISKLETAAFHSCLKKQDKVKELFSTCSSSDEKYQKIIELGRELPPFPATLKLDKNIVKGCQSLMYLSAELNSEGHVIFRADSEALISAGLASLLLSVYNDETPDVVLNCPPRFLTEIGIFASLTVGRSNGFASLYFKIKKKCFNFFIKSSN